MKEIEKQIPAGRRLKILDVGCGAGFFSILLAKEGHEVFGIDLTPDMIEHAEHMAAVLGLDATFRIMDAENPDFEPESFDVLVTRNLTWTLPHVEKAYREWYRILKPGGVLINFDADYSAALEDEQQGGKKHELPENHAHKLVPDDLMAENNAITMEIGAYHGPRPQWDVQLLIERIQKIQSELPALDNDISEEEAAFTEAAEEQLAQTQAQRRFFYLRR